MGSKSPRKYRRSHKKVQKITRCIEEIPAKPQPVQSISETSENDDVFQCLEDWDWCQILENQLPNNVVNDWLNGNEPEENLWILI